MALWSAGRAIEGALSERHCRLRGVQGPLPGDHALRHHGLVPLAVYRRGSATRPALLAAVRDAEGAVTAVEITYLGPGGRRAAGLRLARKTVGVVPPGSAVRLDPPGPDMLVAEGVFTALSARRRFGLPAWALLSTSNLRSWRPPPGVRSVLIAADRGPDGEASARILAKALWTLGIRTRIVLPPAPHGDWNEAEQAGRPSGGGAGWGKGE
ncbi:toprim domain-containing protein [Caulobacter soli]|uniref:toprim domain-containing protein n=1 Tax=Caulobacter soli TaxID=2708539 RepID=UPI003CCDB62C